MVDDIAGIAAGLDTTQKGLPPLCADHDEDCDSIPDKLHCWLYDPAKGSCPYLVAVRNHRKGSDNG